MGGGKEVKKRAEKEEKTVAGSIEDEDEWETEPSEDDEPGQRPELKELLGVAEETNALLL